MTSDSIWCMGKNTKRSLLEAASLIGESAREDGAWKVRLISEGQGSSGFYSRELLEGHHAVFNDVLSFKNHPVGWDGPESRDFTMIAGEVVGETWVEDDERGMASICGWYRPDPDYADKIERYKDKIALSIYAMGDGEFDENTGNYKVTEFIPDPYTSVDVVIAAGARGKFLENARAMYDRRKENASATSAGNTNTNNEGFSEMELKDIGEKLDKLIVAFEAAEESRRADIQGRADEAAVESAVVSALEAHDKHVEAIEAANLLPSQATALREAARKGKDIADAIAEAKVIAQEAREAAGTQHRESGQFAEGAATEYTFKSIKGAK